jgi:hypothetical protein
MTWQARDHASEGMEAIVDRLGNGTTHVVVDSAPPVEIPPVTIDTTGLATGAGQDAILARLGDGTAHVVVDEMPAVTVDTAGLATESTLETLATDAGLASVFTRLGNGSTHVAVDSLPSGLATGAKQDTGNTSIASIDGKLTTCNTGAIAGTVAVSNFPATQPISAASLPLPSGASTEVTLALIKAKTDNLDVALSTRAVTGLTDTQLRASAVPVSGTFWQASQPVSGTFWQATQPISAVALPLPSGAATEATLALIKAKTDNLDVALSTRAVTGLTDAQIRASALPVSGTFWQATQPVSGTFWQATQPVSAAALPLPSGASTEATLALIKAKTDNLDVALSTRAVTGLTDTQLRASAVPVSGTFWQATQPVSAASLPLPSGAAAEHTTAASPHACRLTDGSSFYDGRQIRALTSADQITVANASIAVTGTFWQATQPVSGPLTDAQLRASAVPVSGTFWQATQPISAAALPLPSGASTEATLSTLNGKVTACNTGAVVVSSITPPTLTKGTQGSTGFSTQDLKDAGRVLKTYTVSALATVTSEALIQLTPYADLVSASGATTFAVTAAKRLRIQQIIVTVRCTSTVNVGGIVRLRLLAGTVLVGSPVQGSIGCMGSNLATAVIGNAQTFSLNFPDGLELSGTMQFGLTQLFSATTATIDVHVIGYEY